MKQGNGKGGVFTYFISCINFPSDVTRNGIVDSMFARKLFRAKGKFSKHPLKDVMTLFKSWEDDCWFTFSSKSAMDEFRAAKICCSDVAVPF